MLPRFQKEILVLQLQEPLELHKQVIFFLTLSLTMGSVRYRIDRTGAECHCRCHYRKQRNFSENESKSIYCDSLIPELFYVQYH